MVRLIASVSAMRYPYKGMVLGALVGLVGIILSLLPFGLDLEENFGLDWLFMLRGARTPPPEVVIVSLDKASADRLRLPNEPRNWPRSLHARLVDNLREAGAAVIVFDILFQEAKNADDDNLFAAAVARSRNVVLFEYLKKEILPNTSHGAATLERRIPPIPPLAESAAGLAPFPLPKVPVKVSQFWAFKPSAGDVPTVPVMALQLYALTAYDDFAALLARVSPQHAAQLPEKETMLQPGAIEELSRKLRSTLRNTPFAAEKLLKAPRTEPDLNDTGRARLLTALVHMYQGEDSRHLNFYGPPRTLTVVPYYQVLEERSPASGVHVDLKDKIVFVGFAEQLQPEQKDYFYTVFSQPTGVDLSGVEILATAFANLLEDRPVRPLGLAAHLGVIFLFGMLAGGVCLWPRNSIAIPMLVILCAGYLSLAHYYFASAAHWYPLFIPLFVQAPSALFLGVLWKYIDTNRERRAIRKAFGYYLPHKVVDQLVKNLGDMRATNQLVHGACLATDVERYTALAEHMEAEKLHELMNRYYEAIFQPVRAHGGFVSDVVGDAMLAIWAAPGPDAALRAQACRAALAIVRAVDEFNRRNDLKLPTRIGVYAGEMFLGNVGALDHYEYRAVGDMVNTAARLQNLNKQLGTRLLVSGDTLYGIEDFLSRELGAFVLVGKSKPFVVHQLLANRVEATARQQHLCTLFGAALNAYKERRWDQACTKFEQLLSEFQGDGPSAFYLKLCEHYRTEPPGASWNGAILVESK